MDAIRNSKLPLVIRQAMESILDDSDSSDDEGSDGDEGERQVKRRRSRQRRDPFTSSWGEYLTDALKMDLNPTAEDERQFSCRFRLSRTNFVSLMQRIEQNQWLLPRQRDSHNRPGSPLGLLVMGALAVLGGGVSTLYLKDMTFISATVHRRFFIEFCTMGEQVMFPLYVRRPETEEEIAAAMEPYSVAGLCGAIGSVDATHVPLKNLKHSLQGVHKGKEGYATRSFQVACLNNGTIISCTRGFLGTVTDKTISLYDPFVRGIHDGSLYSNVRWTRLDKNGVGHEMVGCHLICDNGYPDWKTMVAPVSNAKSSDLSSWSRMMESVRKDIECVFGRLKKRFGILHGYNKRSLVLLDSVMFTCCALHNLIIAARELRYEYLTLAERPAIERRVYWPVDRGLGPPRKGVSRSAETQRFRTLLVEHFARKMSSGELLWPQPRAQENA